MSGDFRGGEVHNSWQDQAITRLEAVYRMDDEGKAAAKKALNALGEVLHNKQLASPHTISDPVIVVGGQEFVVRPDAPKVPAAIIDQIVASPVLKEYAINGVLTGIAIQALLNSPIAVRSILGDQLPVLACMDAD